MSDALYTPLLSESAGSLLVTEDVISLPFEIEPTVSYSLLSSEITHHVTLMEKVMRKCIPPSFFTLSTSQFKNQIFEKLPLLVWSEPFSAPECLEICCLTLSSKQTVTENQLIDILKGWIVPGKSTPLLSSQMLHFQWNLFPNEIFLVLQVKLLIKNEKDLSKALLHLPSLSMHILSALKNPSTLTNFFTEHPLLENIKNAEVHKELVFLVEKFPSLFDSSLFMEMSRFFSLCPKSFFTHRTSRLITKIISCHFFMRTNLLRQLAFYPEKKHLEVRFIRTELNFFFGSKHVLGLVLGIAPLDKHEFFEEGHILEAAQSILPGVQCVQGSFYSYQGIQDPLCTLYIELEKKDGSRFLQGDIFILKKELEYELKRRIEKLVPSIFMIRNEEETMRNILILSQELKYLSDLPQVMISLDKQTVSEIVFTVILVRLLKPEGKSLSESFQNLDDEVEFIPDRLQHVGFLRKNYPKEANVFHLKIAKNSSLLRTDYSVNFYLARQKVASLLTKAIGPFRDYNGGMILKQGELFYQFKESFALISLKNSELLENFFFSINPIEMQATLPLASLQVLFRQFLEAREIDLVKKDHYFLKIEEKKDLVFAMIRTQDASFKEEIYASLIRRELWSKALIHTSSHLQGSLYTGFILTHPEMKKHQTFIEAIHEAIRNWKKRLKNQQIIKLSFSYLPASLDPRIDGDEISFSVIKMLFEGLTRLDKKGNPHLAIAQSVEVSEDSKRYLFKLKKTYWSDGSLVTAYDFEHSWKKILSPHFSTPFSYLFHPVKNAQKAKEGLCSCDEVGVSALNNFQLAIDLEYPTPEFLELTALPIYSPVHHVIDKTHPDWGLRGAQGFVCNGPFLLKKTSRNLRYELAKNPFYWDKENVKLEQINLSKDSSLVADSMFRNEETDWLGMPLRPWEPFFEENSEPETSSLLSGVHWCLFNTEKFPFHNVNLRKAFLLSLDQNELASFLPNTCFPATSPLPLSHTMNYNPDAAQKNEALALEFFELALKELGISRKQFPLITLTFADTVLREKTASYLAEKWRALFQIPLRVEKYDYAIFFSKMMKADFQIATLHWKSWVDNPLYTLKIFKHKDDTINFVRWFHPKYQNLLDLAQAELDPIQKMKYLSDAEKLLMEEAPLIPLYYEKENILKKSHLKQVLYSKTTGYLDFKYAYVER